MIQKRIVIIGGGFAGINLAKKLAKKPQFRITLVDKNNYNFFPPLLYQVATGFLEVSNISYPFRKLFQCTKNFNFRLGELLRVVPAENKIVLNNGEVPYDYLVIATGTDSNYFGMENIRRHALPMKTVNDALNLRNFLLQKMEEATITTDEVLKRKLTTIVVAGGGPTGVEVAGMLAEMERNIFRKDYPEMIGHQGAIYLVDAAPVVLAPMSPDSQQYTYESLIKLGVKVKLNKQVKDYVNDTVLFADGDSIETKILIWAAGVTALTFEGIPAEAYGRGRRLLVDQFNKVQGFENIFAIGDTCYMSADAAFPNGHPQVAQVAIQQGERLAKNFLALSENRPPKPFVYHDKGSMAIVGRNKAVAELPKPKLFFKGFVAWFMWLFVHVMGLLTYRNRVKALYNWTIAYFSKDQSLRMIIRPTVAESVEEQAPETARTPG